MDLAVSIPGNQTRSICLGFDDDRDGSRIFNFMNVLGDERYELHQIDESAPGSFRYVKLLEDKDILFPSSGEKTSVEDEFIALNRKFPTESPDPPLERITGINTSNFDVIEWVYAEVQIWSDESTRTKYYLSLKHGEEQFWSQIHFRKQNSLDRILLKQRGENEQSSTPEQIIRRIRDRFSVVQLPAGETAR